MGTKGKILKKVGSGQKKVEFREDAVSSEVVELIGRAGVRGEITQVRCKILEGRDKNKVMRRNVKGPVRKGDILMLKETQLEAAPLTGRRR